MFDSKSLDSAHLFTHSPPSPQELLTLITTIQLVTKIFTHMDELMKYQVHWFIEFLISKLETGVTFGSEDGERRAFCLTGEVREIFLDVLNNVFSFITCIH